MIGKVVSNKMKDTVVVAVETLKPHPLYQKRIKHTKKIKAHTTEEIGTGVMVRIESTLPIAKTVSFKVVEVLNSKQVKGK